MLAANVYCRCVGRVRRSRNPTSGLVARSKCQMSDYALQAKPTYGKGPRRASGLSDV